MASNRFFVGSTKDPNIDEIYEVVFGKPNEQRISLDGSKVIVMLNDNDSEKYQCLVNFKELTSMGACDLACSKEFQKEEV